METHNNGKERKHTSLKKIVLVITWLVIVALLTVNFVMLSRLTKKFDRQMEDNENKLNSLDRRVKDLQADLYYHDWSVKRFWFETSDVDGKTNTASITYHVELKDPEGVDKISMHLSYGAEAELMPTKDGDYVGSATVNLFAEREAASDITFSRNGKEITEAIAWSYLGAPKEQYCDAIPFYEVKEFNYKRTKSKISVDGFTLWRIGRTPAYEVESARIKVVRNGSNEVLDSFDVTDQVSSDSSLLDVSINKTYKYENRGGFKKGIQVILETTTKEGYFTTQYLTFIDWTDGNDYYKTIYVTSPNGAHYFLEETSVEHNVKGIMHFYDNN